MKHAWVIMNTKKKMNLAEAAKWYESEKFTVIHAKRMSNRGVFEDIYILGGYGTYGHRGQTFDYVTDTGLGYGGKGTLSVKNVITLNYNGMILSTEDIMAINEKKALPIWVFK